jgi:murein DD-endopeptidase MepM/ murein hydrolase activator NlpD
VSPGERAATGRVAIALIAAAAMLGCEPPAPAPVYETMPRYAGPPAPPPLAPDPATWGDLIDARDDLVFDGGRLHFELRHHQGRVIQTVRNDYAVEVTLAWGVRDLDNLAPSAAQYGSLTLPASLAAGGPGPTQVLTHFTVLRRGVAFWRILDFRARFGDPAARPTPYAYALPFGVGQERRVIQGFGGIFSHRGSNHYAVDFDAPEGTPILAARDGVVVAANAHVNGRGASAEWLDYARMNFILVRHADGTLGEYLHLAPGGVRVRAGQRVARLDFIGLSGNTGYSTRPHLHFHVMTAAPDGAAAQSFPIEFEIAPGVHAAPVEGRAYRAYERPLTAP